MNARRRTATYLLFFTFRVSAFFLTTTAASSSPSRARFAAAARFASRTELAPSAFRAAACGSGAFRRRTYILSFFILGMSRSHLSSSSRSPLTPKAPNSSFCLYLSPYSVCSPCPSIRSGFFACGLR